MKNTLHIIHAHIRKYAPLSLAVSAGAKLAILGLLLVPHQACAAETRVIDFTNKETPAQQAATVARVEQYLNAITTMKARFTQTNQDGTIDSGTFYLWRPGRLRFEYDAPKSDYIVADGLLIHYWDNGVKNYSNAPIGNTLADFLLRKKISLKADLQVISVRRPAENRLVVTLAQKNAPEAGDVRLLFNENPMQLQKWRVTDGTGTITETALSNIQSGARVEPSLFRFKPPKGYDKDWANVR